MDAADQPAEDRCQEASGSGGGEPDEGELCAFRSWLGDDWLVARDLVVNRSGPAAVELGFPVRAVNDVSSGIPGRPVRRCVYVHPVFHRFVAPEKNENGKNQERQPRFESLSKSVGVNLRSGTA